MNPFPKDHELVSIFESKPEVGDWDIPWYYNTLIFRGIRNGLNYKIRICPAYEEIEIRIGDALNPITHLRLNKICGLTAHEQAGITFLMASFSPDSELGVVKIRLRPYLSIEWL